MKNFILTTILFLIIANSSAAIKRIGYWGTPVTGVDYATSALAVAACAAGDSLYVYGSGWTIDVTKRLNIIGTGYFYAANTPNNTNFNANLQNYNAYTGANIILSDGSSSSVVTGIVGYVYCNASHINSINNIRISNCYWNGVPTMYKNGMTYDGWEISKCYINGGAVGYPTSSTSKVTNFKFLNNILQSGEFGFTNVPGQSGIIENCTFYSYVGYTLNNLNGANLLIQNCIFTSSPQLSGYSNTVFNNCVFDYLPSPGIVGANNITSATLNNIFIGYPTQGTNSNDFRWSLKPGSPALAAGVAGIDCGAFGGVNPYKLSGIPAIPAFIKLTAPGTAANTNPYTLTFSVKANN
jgi:hypothetical protein